MKTAFLIVAALIGFAALIFCLQAFDFNSYKFWAPQYENARRHVFENTKSFLDGSRRDLDNMSVAYHAADSPAEKEAIRDVMLHRSKGIPPEQISPEVQSIINGT